MAISFTPAALERVRRFVRQTPECLGLRFGVMRTGCCGYGYVVDYAREQQANDCVFQQDGVRVFVAQEDLVMVDGTVIDLQQRGLNATLTFANPNVTAQCGCGDSFTTQPSPSEPAP